MKKPIISSLFVPLALSACAPSPESADVRSAITESAEAQGGVCPGQVFNFISDFYNGSLRGSSTGYARVEIVREDGTAVLSVVSRRAKTETGDVIEISEMPMRNQGCGNYTPQLNYR